MRRITGYLPCASLRDALQKRGIAEQAHRAAGVQEADRLVLRSSPLRIRSIIPGIALPE